MSRAIGILAATLLLGIVLGVLGAGALANARALKIEGARGPGGFVNHMEEIIQPTAEQTAAVRPLLEGFDQQNREIIQGADQELRDVIESMRTELEPLLTDEQNRRLEEFSRRPRPRPGGPPGLGGPPGAGGPPGGVGPPGAGGPPGARPGGPPPGGQPGARPGPGGGDGRRPPPRRPGGGG